MKGQTHRYLARFLVENCTPLVVGSGESSLIKDALVQKDANGLPMIPGTSLAGVLRHAVGSEFNEIFGFEEQNKDEGRGSRVKVSTACMVLGRDKVSEGIIDVPEEIIERFENLPKRQHVRINSRGVAKKDGLFDNEIVYKGCRFVFEIELQGTEADRDKWGKLIEMVIAPTFRLGGGTRKGYGSLNVLGINTHIFDLTNKEDRQKYLDYNVEFSNNLPVVTTMEQKATVTYTLELTPDSFFLFGGNFGDDEVDNKPLEELVAVYDGSGHLIAFNQFTVIPASSVKGALSHRTAFHYNRIKKRFADKYPNLECNHLETLFTGIGNKAVAELFGLGAGDELDKNAKTQAQEQGFAFNPLGAIERGHVIIDDLYFDDNDVKNNKIFNHVAIDRFTGGAKDSALFSEKVSNAKDKTILLKIYIDNNATGDGEIIKAFENALEDIAKGLLPLGGMTTKGHGIFTGVLKRGDEIIYEYPKESSKNDN